MTTEIKNAVEIASLKEQINGLREQSKAHAEETRRNFGELKTEARELRDTCAELLATMNRGKGAFAASLAVASIIGAFAAKTFALGAALFTR